MTMEVLKFLTPKKYAAYNGCDVVIIERAIKAGKIPAECICINPVNKYKSINVAMSDAAWGNNYREKRRRTNKSILRRLEEKPIDEKVIVSDLSRSEDDIPNFEMPVLGAKTSYTEADRQKKIYEAQLLQHKLKEETGLVVKIDVIENAFFEHVRIVRDNLTSLADRIIDQVVSAGTRNEAYLVLQHEIEKALTVIATIPEWRNE